MTKVLVFGTFDLLHPGHLHFFEQAKTLGDTLVVIVATDKNVERIKGKAPREKQEVRIKNIEACHVATTVLLAPEDYDYIALLKREEPDVIALGYDQRPTILTLKKELATHNIPTKLVRLKPHKPAQYKSSLIKINSV